MMVLWTFRRPFMGRPVSRQLLRNALRNLTTIVPTTAYHRRSYTKRYSRSIHDHTLRPDSMRFVAPCGQPWIPKPCGIAEVRTAMAQVLPAPVHDAPEEPG